MNKTIAILVLLVLVIVGIFIYRNNTMKNNNLNSEISIIPISHATMVLKIGGKVVYTDPVGGAEAFTGQSEPDIILITDIHPDHLSTSTLSAIVKDRTTIIAPKAVVAQFPKGLKGAIITLANGERTVQAGVDISAVPMYNYPETKDSFHTKGRGNGYILSMGNKKVYIAGDTGNIPEMATFTNIDIAFLPMNLPYTMSVEDAAKATLVFKPKMVIPYHYRGQDGLSDTNKFKELVNAGDSKIDVNLLNFYPTN